LDGEAGRVEGFWIREKSRMGEEALRFLFSRGEKHAIRIFSHFFLERLLAPHTRSRGQSEMRCVPFLFFLALPGIQIHAPGRPISVPILSNSSLEAITVFNSPYFQPTSS
jgi:hypothetical protein